MGELEGTSPRVVLQPIPASEVLLGLFLTLFWNAESIKSPAFLHPSPPFLWGEGWTLAPRNGHREHANLRQSKVLGEPVRPGARYLRVSQTGSALVQPLYLSRQISRASLDLLSKSEPRCQAALAFRTYNYECQTNILP